MSLLVAVGIYLALGFYLTGSLPTATSNKEIGNVAAHGLFRTLASIGQYALPLIFVIGSFMNFLGRWRRGNLFNSVASADSSAALGSMTWQSFEELVQEAFLQHGYRVRRIGGDGPDGGVDLELRRGSELVLVQCKQWRAYRVGVAVVRELYGVMAARGATAGIVVTSGTFTKDAVDFAAGRNLRLVAGEELFALIRNVRYATPEQVEIGSTASLVTGYGPPDCPVCGKAMVRRQAKRGPDTGKAFYGCSGFPQCRGTRPID